MGNEYSEYSDRDPKAERSLTADAEGELVEAGKRIRQLTARIEHLHRVLEVLKQV